jgi:Holliday junction resolvase-like predicted endonuclease
MLNVIVKQIQNSPDLSFIKQDKLSKDFFDEISRYSELGLSPEDAMHIRIAQDIACNYFVTEDADILKLSHKLETKGFLDFGFKIASIEEILQTLNTQLRSEDPIPAGSAFENFVIDYFQSHGYNILINTSKKDEGIDFLVEKNGKKFAVQTKLYLKSPVSSSEIERFLNRRLKEIDGFWIVSPSGFSEGASKIAEKRPNEIKLLNARDYIKKSYPKQEKMAQNRLKRFYETKIEPEIDFDRLTKHWDGIKKARTNKEKKETLENLAVFLFGSIDRIRVIDKNVRTSAEEIDLILKNESTNPFWHQLGDPLLVECKNWNKKIGTSEVIVFKDKLETQGLKVGILVAINGLTGTKRKDAILKIREYRQREFRIIVLTGEDIEDICKGENPTDKLQEKYYDLFKL